MRRFSSVKVSIVLEKLSNKCFFQHFIVMIWKILKVELKVERLSKDPKIELMSEELNFEKIPRPI